MERPLVSIIINNYNYANYIEEALVSALNQTYDNIEVVVVDDGSTDHSRDLIKRYSDRVRTVLKENGGQGSAFNEGFKYCNGQIILFLDSDDALYLNAVEEIVKAFYKKENIAKVHYRLDIVNSKGVKLNQVIPGEKTPLLEGDISEILLKYGPGSYTNPPTTGNAFSRYALENVLPMPTDDYRISADGYLFMTVPFFGELVTITNSLGVYRIHDKNGFWQTSLEMTKLHTQVQLYDVRVLHLKKLLKKINKAHLIPKIWAAPLPQATRMTTFKLNRENHKRKNDTLLRIYKDGMVSTWLGPITDLRRRIFLSAYLTALLVLPKEYCHKFASWFFVPESRPSILKNK